MPEVKGLKELKLSVGQLKGKADMAEIIYENILPCLFLLIIFCHAEFISASIQ